MSQEWTHPPRALSLLARLRKMRARRPTARACESTLASTYAVDMVRWLTTLGAVLVVAGLMLVPLPGPGWLIVVIGAVLLVAAAAVHRGTIGGRSRR